MAKKDERVFFAQRIRREVADKVRKSKPSEYTMQGWTEDLLRRGLDSRTKKSPSK